MVRDGAEVPQVPLRFRERGRDITRLEGFSDCAFGFAITLLVLSLEVPSSFQQLLRLMSGVPVFAVTFAMIAYIWYTQYRFYRRFGVEDLSTIVLNMALLFVVLVYVYPLKFMFAALFRVETPFEARGLFVLYGLGFCAVFLVLGLLYLNGLRQGVRLDLSAAERAMTRGWIEEQWLTAGIGIISVLLALVVPPSLLWLPGMWYFAIAGVRTVAGFRNRRRLRRFSAPNAG
ncbi:MAG: DUF1211 domain-containing protein, partial [Candidatus Dormibacteraeota bacterium]|nr:DUF1211 domain-containing protein [Candidatus Dormibacteraeota bacterium]